MTHPSIEDRKDAHIDLCLNEDVGSGGVATGLGGYALEYDAIPDLDLDDVDLSVTILGRTLKAPVLVGAMTGGTERAGRLNRVIAKAAARVGIGMALGSQRVMVAQPDLAHTFAVREAAPELPLLLGNIGAVQLNYGVSVTEILGMLQVVRADALNFHLNALQEAIQPEGDTRFKGLFERLSHVIPEIPMPCLVKEVGAGISRRTAARLARLPLTGIETAGVGGTSWAKVESFRASKNSIQAEVGRRLAGLGVPTAAAIVNCRRAFGERLVVASGGIRTGMDVAIAIALGADVVALARPVLEAANEGEDAAVHVLETLIYELRVICFCTGARNLEDLRHVPVIAPGASFTASETETP